MGQSSCPATQPDIAVRSEQPTNPPIEVASLSLASQEELPARRPFFALGDVPPDKPPFALDPSGTISVPSPINRYLKDYQRQGVKFLYDRYAAGKGAILGDDMGYVSISCPSSPLMVSLGKTVQVIAFVSLTTGLTDKSFRPS